MAEQQQAPQVAVAHHLSAHLGRPGHDAHAAGWAPLTSAAALVNLPAQACMCPVVSSARAWLQLSAGGSFLHPKTERAGAARDP